MWVVLCNGVQNHHQLSDESSNESNLGFILSSPTVNLNIWLLENLFNWSCLIDEVLLYLFLELGDLSCFSLCFSLSLSCEFGGNLVLCCLFLSSTTCLNHIIVLFDFFNVPLTSSRHVIVNECAWVLFVSIQLVELILSCFHEPWKNIRLDGVSHELILEVSNISQKVKGVDLKTLKVVFR